MSTLFTESAVAPTKTKSGNWRAVLITPGKGSSGFYSESMLKEHGPVAFPKGTHSYIDHPTREGEVRSPKNLMGVLAEDAYYEEGVGLVAELQVMPHWKEFVEAVAPHTGLSIYAMGDGQVDENGELVVESLIPNVQNSVDLVSYAGRPGSGLAEKLYESAIAMFTEAAPGELAEKDLVKWASGDSTYYGQVAYIMTSGVFPFEGDPLQIEASADAPVALVRKWDFENGDWQPTQELVGAPVSALTKVSALGESKRGTNGTATAATETEIMEGNPDMEELKAMLEELNEKFAALAETLTTPAEEPTEEVEAVDPVEVAAEVAEAVAEAALPAASRKAVYEAMKTGKSVEDAIVAQKELIESLKASLVESAPAATAEEAVVVPTVEKAETFRDILNIKVG
jgi:hypothetical protein